MDPLVSTLILILVALAGARVSFSTTSIPAGPRLLFRTGIHFVVLGFALGPHGLGLLTAEDLPQLYPLLGIALGWVGLLFGMQLDRHALAHFPGSYLAIALGQAALTFGLVLGGAILAFGWLGLEGEIFVLLAVAGAATASISTPAAVAVVSSNFLAKGPLLRLLFFVASLDGVVGIIALQWGQALYPSGRLVNDVPTFSALSSFGLSIGLGVACTVLLLWLLRLKPRRAELVMYLLGISALGSGLALQLQLAPLFVCAVMGFGIVNVSEDRDRVFRALVKWEKPIYLVLLLLAGALLGTPTLWMLGLGIAYMVIRAVAKGLSGAVLGPLAGHGGRASRSLGLALVPQGGVTLALAVSFVMAYQGLLLPDGSDGLELFLGVIVVGVILSESIGLYFTIRTLRAAGEIDPKVEAALSEGDQDGAKTEALRAGGGAATSPPDS